jgi:hypothetical protein
MIGLIELMVLCVCGDFKCSALSIGNTEGRSTTDGLCVIARPLEIESHSSEASKGQIARLFEKLVLALILDSLE